MLRHFIIELYACINRKSYHTVVTKWGANECHQNADHHMRTTEQLKNSEQTNLDREKRKTIKMFHSSIRIALMPWPNASSPTSCHWTVTKGRNHLAYFAFNTRTKPKRKSLNKFVNVEIQDSMDRLKDRSFSHLKPFLI